jgi:hypothetical protein
MKKIMSIPEIEHKWDSEEVEKEILKAISYTIGNQMPEQ